MKTGRKFLIKYTIICLDVWGHGPDECCSSFNCPCVDTDENDKETHDPDAFNHGECDAEFTVNDMHKCGSIEVLTNEVVYNSGTPNAFTSHHPEDKDIIKALIDSGHLKTNVKPDDIEIDGEDDTTLFLRSTDDDKPLFHLEYESSILEI